MTASTQTAAPERAAEARAAWSTMRADRRFLWFWLSVATGLSVGGNGGHAQLTVVEGPTRWMAIGWAVAPPILLMLAIHGLPTLARMLGSDKRDKLLSAVVWGVTIGAFGWSAFGIFGFTTEMGVPKQIAWVAPLVIDLSVYGATRGLVLTAPQAARMKAEIAAHTNPSTSRRRAILNPGSRTAPGPVHRPTTIPAPAHQPVPSAPPTPPPAPALERTVTVEADTRPPTPVVRTPPEPATAPVPTAEIQPEPAAQVSVSRETRALAEQIVASGAVRKPVDTVAAILSAAERETRKATIAEQTGVHHSVVTKTLDAADSYRRHQLAAVG